MPPDAGAEPSVARAALACRCPRCGRGPLFAGVLRMRERCPVCGLAYGGADTGDSFVVPILIVLGAIVVGAAMWVDFTWTPPFWVHALIWPPVTAVLALLMTRYLKSFFAVQQYHVRRREFLSE